ncbi:hypothetical protein L873DRAFT_1334918 [Choiromyces venosus 120613-1]|uniref:Uncharacterized protein n=1 Tax=Choiromyces venosus 120613-1 TaxID=1336337 RepID=A0A3N4JFT3_9PEZI|nr:hypothetical protein L873DRAFT_1334918 [Choiromyces venosus 120613-1]
MSEALGLPVPTGELKIITSTYPVPALEQVVQYLSKVVQRRYLSKVVLRRYLSEHPALRQRSLAHLWHTLDFLTNIMRGIDQVTMENIDIQTAWISMYLSVIYVDDLVVGISIIDDFSGLWELRATLIERGIL